jgi:hypothetical protein
MNNEDALAVISVSSEVLAYRRHFGNKSTADLPLGLIRQTLEYIEERIGAGETAFFRARLVSYGIDFLDLPTYADAERPEEKKSTEHEACDPDSPTESQPDSTNSEDSQSPSRAARSRIPVPIEEAIRAKHLAGWSKSRIAREFRLNRRNVIRVCSGQ